MSAPTWMNLKNAWHSEGNQLQKTSYYNVIDVKCLGISKSVETESKLVVTRA